MAVLVAPDSFIKISKLPLTLLVSIVYFIFRRGLYSLRSHRLWFSILVVSLLSACSGMPVEPEVDQKTQAEWQRSVQQRQAQLATLTNWRFNGRISLVTTEEAWSGQIFWHQIDEEYFIQFSAPSGQGAIQITGNPQGVELRLANGDTYQAKDADSLLRQETTWDLPISGLWYWIRGLPDPRLSNTVQLDQQGMIQELSQDSWQVRYERYQLYDNHHFPRKIVIRNKDMKVRLIATDWIVS